MTDGRNRRLARAAWQGQSCPARQITPEACAAAELTSGTETISAERRYDAGRLFPLHTPVSAAASGAHAASTEQISCNYVSLQEVNRSGLAILGVARCVRVHFALAAARADDLPAPTVLESRDMGGIRP